MQSVAALTAAGVVVGPLGLVRATAAGAGRPSPVRRLGDLRPVGAELLLPPGFRYVRFDVAGHRDPELGTTLRAGDVMSDGAPMPGAHDGTGYFARGRTVTIVRNHELNPFVGDVYQGIDGTVGQLGYDPSVNAGVTITRFDLQHERVVANFVALRGTVESCSGGTTPWGTWLSAEETTAGIGAGLSKPHGYVFEVPAASSGEVAATPIPAMGRFVHEAAAVDPRTGIVYMTEDNGDPYDGLYRFLPNRYRNLLAGGRLQMLAVEGAPNFSAADARVGTRYRCHWVDVADPDPTDAEDNPGAVFAQGDAGGAMRFVGNEGANFANGSLVFTESDGGPAELGQVWRYTPGWREGEDDCGPRRARWGGGMLELVFRSGDDVVTLNPDSVVVSPRGAVLFAEDGDGEDVDGVRPEHIKLVTGPDSVDLFCASQVQLDIHLHNLTEDPEDQLPVGARGYSEFTGLGFVGDWMFCHLQYPGETYAITGPWRNGGI
jgi:secreted PhoX family phosphatase